MGINHLKAMTFCFQIQNCNFSTNSFEVCYIMMDKLSSLNAQLNPICHLLAFLRSHHIIHASRKSTKCIHRFIQNFSYRCRHLFRSCGSAKHRKIVGLPCLASQRAMFHVVRMTWAVFTRFCFEYMAMEL